jgi:hypothetical protein
MSTEHAPVARVTRKTDDGADVPATEGQTNAGKGRDRSPKLIEADNVVPLGSDVRSSSNALYALVQDIARRPAGELESLLLDLGEYTDVSRDLTLGLEEKIRPLSVFLRRIEAVRDDIDEDIDSGSEWI